MVDGMMEKKSSFFVVYILILSTALLYTTLENPGKSVTTVEAPPGPTVQTLSLDKRKRQKDRPEEQEAQLMPWAHKLEGVTVTYYDCCVACCWKEDRITYSGTQAIPYETCAVDPGVIPLGASVSVDYGDGVLHHYRAEDIGGGVKGNHIDICVSSHGEALELGVRTATVYWMEVKNEGKR